MDNLIAYWPAVLRQNWTEERYKAYEDLHLFLARKAAGDLEIQRHQKKTTFHNQPVKTSLSETPFINFGAAIQLDNSSHRLAAEAEDTHMMANVSGICSKANNWRSCFQLRPEPGFQAKTPWLNDQRDKSILHYGERVSLCTCNDLQLALVVRTLASGGQHVLFFHKEAGPERHWQVLAVDPEKREVLMGLPVANGDNAILKHCLTGQLLCLEPKLKHTDFGTERLVTARAVVDIRRRNTLEMIKQGDVLGELGPLVGHENFWRISLATGE